MFHALKVTYSSSRVMNAILCSIVVILTGCSACITTQGDASLMSKLEFILCSQPNLSKVARVEIETFTTKLIESYEWSNCISFKCPALTPDDLVVSSCLDRFGQPSTCDGPFSINGISHSDLYYDSWVYSDNNKVLVAIVGIRRSHEKSYISLSMIRSATEADTSAKK